MTKPFADIFGQDEAILRLQQAWLADRLPHAMLLAGPAGVGRRTTALAMAQALLCSQPVRTPTAPLVQAGHDASLARLADIRQACGRCHDCRMVAGQIHPDLHVIQRELAKYHDDAQVRERKMQDLGIDVIRQFLLGPANLYSARGRGKVFIVLEADLMSQEAQNALLKTLEEPPPGVVIFLIAESPQQLLATTVSRCGVIRLGRLDPAFVRRKLLEQGMEAGEAGFWSIFTQGSLGGAMKLSQQGLYPIKRQLVGELAGLPRMGKVGWSEQLEQCSVKLADEALRRAMEERQIELARTVASRDAAAALLALLSSAVRDALVLASRSDQPLVNADQRAEISALAGRFTPDQLAEILEQLATYEQLLWRNVNQKLLWDNVAITCAAALPLRLGEWA